MTPRDQRTEAVRESLSHRDHAQLVLALTEIYGILDMASGDWDENTLADVAHVLTESLGLDLALERLPDESPIGAAPVHESPSYREAMRDAGRGHLLP